MGRFPILIDLENSNVLVAGKGHLAIAKIRLLLAAGASVSALVYDDEKISDEFKNEIEIIRGSFKAKYLAGKKLLYMAGVSRVELDTLIREAKFMNIPYNHVDDPANSNFSTPAMVHRGPVTISISTEGKAPVLSRNIRRKIEQILPNDLGSLVELLYEYRAGVNKLIGKASNKLTFWNRIYSDSEINRLLKLNPVDRRKSILKSISTTGHSNSIGHVMIVGAGPGDPELLTLKAHRALQEADVIIYDNLIPKKILNLSRRDAELIYVGKKRGDHSRSQDQINQIIIESALKGLMVVRLKGGDPSIFGRLAEELDALNRENISYEIVPGITAASGISASSSIPLTHRNYSSMITFATGQLKKGQKQDWKGLAGKSRTIAIYMGIGTAIETSNSLIKDGFSPQTPVAIIENGTRNNERRFYGYLEELGELVGHNKIESPALLIVGEVVATAPDFAASFPAELRMANCE